MQFSLSCIGSETGQNIGEFGLGCTRGFMQILNFELLEIGWSELEIFRFELTVSAALANKLSGGVTT